MPQMSPLNWLILFSFFIFVLMMFISQIFYSFLTKTSLKNKEMKKVKNNLWKW